MPTSPKGRGANTGFTLIELAIVIVIIGLLAGGVLVGRDMIRAAELRSITTEYEKYVAAVNVFQDKYLGLPGDLKNATAFWGAAHATPATCLTTVGTGTQTCDGDGDGQVEFGAAPSRHSEVFAFWQHLANAGLIEGVFSRMAGAGGAIGTYALVGINVPKSKLGAAGWSTYSMGTYAGDAAAYATYYGNQFTFGSEIFPGSSVGYVLTPQEAYNIDLKIDDGKPAYGKLIARNWNNGCAAADDGTHTNSDLNASYKLSETGIVCSFFFADAY